MGPSQICECPFREPRVFTIAHIYYMQGGKVSGCLSACPDVSQEIGYILME